MIEKLGNVFYRVRDMDTAVTFYAQVLGLRLKFRDGNNWAAFDVAGVTLALEGGSSQPGATVSLRVRGLDELVVEQRQAAPCPRDLGARALDQALQSVQLDLDDRRVLLDRLAGQPGLDQLGP